MAAITAGELRAVLFDLDGVVTDTAGRHTAAWRRLAVELGWRFDEDLHDALRGVGRLDALGIIASRNAVRLSLRETADLAERKNRYYVESLASLGPGDILPGIEAFLGELAAAGVRTALASASRNALMILAMLGIAQRFEVVADPSIVAGKPDPGIFLECARSLGLSPSVCVGIEDAQAGMDAIKAAGMRGIAVGARLAGADACVAGTEGLSLRLAERLFTSDRRSPAKAFRW